MAAQQAALPAQQERVRRALEDIGEAGWLRHPRESIRARLDGLGHFPQFPGELAWPACGVVGHARTARWSSRLASRPSA